MLTPGRIWPGSQVDLTVAFRDQSGGYADPSTVTLKLMSPEHTESSFTYGTDDEVSKQGTGQYTARVTPDKAGRWHFRWESTSPVAIHEGDFLVQRSPFVDDPGYFRDYA